MNAAEIECSRVHIAVMPASVQLWLDRSNTANNVCKLVDSTQPAVRLLSCSVNTFMHEVVHREEAAKPDDV